MLVMNNVFIETPAEFLAKITPIKVVQISFRESQLPHTPNGCIFHY